LSRRLEQRPPEVSWAAVVTECHRPSEFSFMVLPAQGYDLLNVFLFYMSSCLNTKVLKILFQIRQAV